MSWRKQNLRILIASLAGHGGHLGSTAGHSLSSCDAESRAFLSGWSSGINSARSSTWSKTDARSRALDRRRNAATYLVTSSRTDVSHPVMMSEVTDSLRGRPAAVLEKLGEQQVALSRSLPEVWCGLRLLIVGLRAVGA